MLHAAAALQRRLARLPARLDRCRRSAPLIATLLLATFGSGYAVGAYLVVCGLVSVVVVRFLPDYTNRDISEEHAATLSPATARPAIG